MKFSNLLFVISAAMLSCVSAQAQEESLIEGPDPAHREANFNEDKTLIYEHPSQSSVVLKDSALQAPKPLLKPARTEAPSKENPKERNEEDALSFNFLYYMIQKFKLSDLVDN